jgi:3-dehydroquinate synthase
MTTANKNNLQKAAHEHVAVDLGDRQYLVHIGPGLIDEAVHYIGDLIKDRHVVIIADENVSKTHLPRLKTAIGKHLSRLDHITVPSGEDSKSIAAFGTLMEDILALNIDRKVMLVALGGGVIGDLAGFAAASLLRGVDFIQIPTTLLAQVDSAVGGKTGINAKAGKNLIGAFHQPQAVLADIDTLKTLPAREMRAGYAEVIKYSLLGDADFFDWLEETQENILSLDDGSLVEVVARCCRAKASIVAEDEKEAGRRALLNLGHTFGHAYEAEAGYDGTVLHGEAVAAGITDAYRLGVRLGTVNQDDLDRVKSHLERAGLPVNRSMLSDKLREADLDRLMGHMQKDKKVAAGKIVFIVPNGIGDARIEKNVDAQLARDVMEKQE